MKGTSAQNRTGGRAQNGRVGRGWPVFERSAKIVIPSEAEGPALTV